MSDHSEKSNTYDYFNERGRRQRGPPNVKQTKRREKYSGLKYG